MSDKPREFWIGPNYLDVKGCGEYTSWPRTGIGIIHVREVTDEPSLDLDFFERHEHMIKVYESKIEKLEAQLQWAYKFLIDNLPPGEVQRLQFLQDWLSRTRKLLGDENG